MHWADKYAEELLVRGGKQVIETGTSISGIPHIGNASDVIRGDAVRKALEGRCDVELIWVADDSDPFRKIPKGMESLKDYLGYPVKDIPDPDGCHKNFVEHFADGLIDELASFGVKPTVYSGTDLYRSGALNDEVGIALNNREEIIEILNRFRTTPLPKDYIPWTPICENCGRISTTKTYGFDDGKVGYTCQTVELSGGEIEGCGFKGESDLKKGYGKLPWRVEWAARWKHFKVTCEPLGKEHSAAGGSFWTAREICEKIFGWEPPVPVMYEFFTLNGEKISSSRGNVITLGDWLRICEPEVLKYFMYKRLMKQRDINLSTIPNLVDEYDEAERVYFNLEEGDFKARRRYELSQITEPKLLQVPFTLCTTLAQIVPDLDLEKIRGKLTGMGYEGFDNERLRSRLMLAKNWVEGYGPEYLRFKLITDSKGKEIHEKLDEKQREALSKLAGELNKKWLPKELHKRIYEISRGIDLEPQKLFEAIYMVLIGKRKGPKAAGFILTLDNDFVQNRFKE